MKITKRYCGFQSIVMVGIVFCQRDIGAYAVPFTSFNPLQIKLFWPVVTLLLEVAMVIFSLFLFRIIVADVLSQETL